MDDCQAPCHSLSQLTTTIARYVELNRYPVPETHAYRKSHTPALSRGRTFRHLSHHRPIFRAIILHIELHLHPRRQDFLVIIHPRDTISALKMTPSLNGASGPVFPTEVFEHIIDIIAEGDGYFYNGEKVPSLHACALVARSWVPRSRIHLYRDIELDSDLRTTQFLDSVTKSPALGKYVRFLMIWPLSDKRESSGGWIFRAINILPPLLPHLYELILWSLPDLHPVYIAVLSRFRTIESLELRFIDWNSLQEIVQLINRFPRLRRLRVRDCGWKVPGRCYHGKQHNLSSLEMQRNHLSVKPLLEWVFESDSTRALTAFCTESHVSASALDRILQSCCSTLRELSLVFYGDEGERLYMMFLLRMLTSILKLRFPLSQSIVLFNASLFADP